MDTKPHITIKRDAKITNRWWLKCSCGYAQWFYKYSGARKDAELHFKDHSEKVMEPCS